jgi:hypothetical protein
VGEEVNILESMRTERDGAWREMYVKDILDGRIEGPKAGMVDKIICLLKTAFECINESPAERPSMREVPKIFSFLISVAAITLMPTLTTLILLQFLISCMRHRSAIKARPNLFQPFVVALHILITFPIV